MAYLSKPLLDASHAEDMRRQAATLSTQVQQAQPPPTPDPVEEAPPLDWGSHIKSLLATWQDTPEQGGASSTSMSTTSGMVPPGSSSGQTNSNTNSMLPSGAGSPSPSTQPFDLSAHIQSLLAPWRDEKPTTSQGAEPSTPSSTGLPPSISAPYADRVPTPSGTPAAMPAGAPPAGPVDNSSRESFVRTAYPQALAAADGDPVLAQQLLATAISENGKVGTGRSLGEMGNNVGGIQGVQGSAGSFTAMDAGRPRQFAAYNTLAEGFRAVRDLVSGGRYAQAAATYQQTHDIDRYWGDVNRAGYSETPDWQDRIANIRRTQVEPITRGLNTTIPGPDQSPNGTPITAPAQQGRTAPSAGLDTQGIVKAYENTSYTYGGPGGRTQGFGAPTDCSGFVAAVFKSQYGIDLVPHTDGAYNQLRGVGAPEVSVKDARPGDVVFYMGAGTGGAITHHMGIYAGNGQVLDDSVSGQDGVRVRDVGHAGQYVILRDPRLNQQAPQTASTPPPIVPTGVAEQSGGTRLSERQINAASQDAAGLPSPAAAPAVSASQPDPPQAALAEAPPSGQGGPPWEQSTDTDSSQAGMPLVPHSTSQTQTGETSSTQPTSGLMLRQPLNQPTSGPDTVPGNPRVRVLAGQNPNEPVAAPMPGNVDDQATGANRTYSPPPDSVPDRGWIDRAVQQPDDRLPGYQRGDVTDAEGLDRTNDELYPVPGPAVGNTGTAPIEPGVMYRQPLGPATSGPDTFPTDASGSGVGASGSGPETPPYPASQAIPNEDATSYPRPAYVPPAEPLVLQNHNTGANVSPDSSNPDTYGVGSAAQSPARFDPLAGNAAPAQPSELPTPSAPATKPIKPLYDMSGNVLGYVREQAQNAAQGASSVVQQAAPVASAAFNAARLPNPIQGIPAVASAAQETIQSSRGQITRWQELNDKAMAARFGQGPPLTPDEEAEYADLNTAIAAGTLAGPAEGHFTAPDANAAAPITERIGNAVQDIRGRLTAGSERTAALDAERAASGQVGQPAYGALGAVPDAPAYSPTAPEGFTRRYHGTASDFERANADKFDPNGLYGPGYYTTSDPRVAGSYSSARVAQPNNFRVRTQRINELERQLAQPGLDDAARSQLSDELSRYQDILGDALGDARPNVRPLDVPNNLNLIDVDAPLDPDLLTRVRASVEKIAERRPDVAAEFQDELWGLQSDLKRRGADSSVPELNNDALVKVLMDAAERVGRVDDTVGGKALATEILQRSGYDGIAHTGGQRVPMLDGAGQPIEHDVTIVFPGAVSKVRNALAGTYGGARLGAPAASASDPLARATNVLGRGAMASIYGGAAGLTNQAMNPDDPNAFVKGALPAAALSAFGPQAARAALRAAGKVAPEAEGALAALGNAPVERQISRNIQRLTEERAAQGVEPPNMLERFQAYRHSVGMLGNFAGGLLNAVSGPAEIALGLPTEAVRMGVLKGRPAPVIYEAAELAKGTLEGVVQLLGTAAGIIPKAVRDAPDFRPPLYERETSAISKGIGYAIDTPGRITAQAPDAMWSRAFTRWGRAREAASMVSEQGAGNIVRPDQQISEMHRLLTDPTPEEAQRIEEGAKKFAQELTYKGKAGYWERTLGTPFRPQGGTTTANDSTARQVHDVLGSFLMPFYSSLFKIHKTAMTRVPGAGLLADTSLPLSEKLSRQAVGAGLGIWAANYAAQGMITGPGPSDSDEAAAMRGKGIEPNSTYVPGVGFVPNQAFGSAGPILNVIGAYYDAQRYMTDKEKADDWKKGEATAKYVMRSFEQFPVAQAALALYKMGSSPIEGATDLLANAGSSLIPSAVKTYQLSQDPNVRTTERGVSPPERLEQKLLSRSGAVPGLGTRQDLPAAQDRYGRDVENPRQGMAALLPKLGQPKDDPLGSVFAENDVAPGTPPPTVRITMQGGKGQPSTGYDIPLSPAEQREWNRLRGQALSAAVPELLRDPNWQGATPEQRKQYLQLQLTRANASARGQLLQQIGDDELTRRMADVTQAKAS